VPKFNTNFLLAKVLLVLAGLALATASSAAEPKVLDQLNSATCAGFFPPILGHRSIAIVLAERAIDAQSVCSCGRARLELDGRLAEFLAMDNETFVNRVQDERVRSYIVTRVMQSLVQCLATELDKSLAASTAVK
jgi:hypothetical protein